LALGGWGVSSTLKHKDRKAKRQKKKEKTEKKKKEIKRDKKRDKNTTIMRPKKKKHQ
jgi:hypothetical protein